MGATQPSPTHRHINLPRLKHVFSIRLKSRPEWDGLTLTTSQCTVLDPGGVTLFSQHRSGTISECTRGWAGWRVPHNGWRATQLPEELRPLAKALMGMPIEEFGFFLKSAALHLQVPRACTHHTQPCRHTVHAQTHETQTQTEHMTGSAVVELGAHAEVFQEHSSTAG